MKSEFSKERKLLGILLLVSIIIFNVLVFINSREGTIVYITMVFSLVVLLIMILYDVLFKRYMRNIFITLSDMLSTIIDGKKVEFFSCKEESLLSKLQYQTNKLTDILKSQKDKVEEDRNEIKSLISDISHQLKTPLTNLKIYSELILDDTLEEKEKKEFNMTIINSVDKLLFLGESMIKMSRLESGVITLKSKKNNLNKIVIEAIKEVSIIAKLKKIDINILERDNVEISCDKNWLKEGIFNILENSVKYTDTGGRIEVMIQNYEIFTRVDIKDNGIGIETEEIPKIFARFYRGKGSELVEGIGIGLYLTREIISMHGGYIKVKSIHGETNFSIFLPRNV